MLNALIVIRKYFFNVNDNNNFKKYTKICKKS